MSKDLKTQYRMLADSRTPDLWARIEKGLDRPDLGRADDTVPVRKNRRFQYDTLAAAAAACLCAAIALPVLIRGSAGGSMDRAGAPMALSEEGAYSDAPPSDASALSGSASPADEPDVYEESALEDIMPASGEDLSVTVEILDGGRPYAGGIIYAARMLSDDEALDGRKIKIFADDGSRTAYEAAGIYELTLHREEQAEDILYRIIE